MQKKELAYPWHTFAGPFEWSLRGLLRGRLLGGEPPDLNFMKIGLFANVFDGID